MAEDPVVQSLAKNILQLRKLRGLTQAKLAAVSGIPRTTITHMESGLGNPTVAAISRIAGALQVPLEELLQRPRGEYHLVKANDVPKVERAGGKAVMHKLMPERIRGMEIDRLVLQPGTRMRGVPHLEHTKEYITCLKGRMEVYCGGERFLLSEGDVLAFPGNQAHSYYNPGRSPAVSVSVVALAFESPSAV